MAAAAEEAPWSVEVPECQVKFVEGPDGDTLRRLSKALRCEIEVSYRGRKGKGRGRVVHFQGQQQVVEDEDGDEGNSKTPVKIFIRGGVKQRLAAAEVLEAVAQGDDPEDLIARAEGGIVFPHELQHPDREAWARWRLLSVGYDHGVRAYMSKRMVRLMPRPGSSLQGEAADKAQVAAEGVIDDAEKLSELSLNARCELEPEDAISDGAVAPLVDQYGVIIRVADEDDNAVSETVAVRVIGPTAPAKDAVEMLSARFIKGKKTASILQVIGQVQAMTTGMAKDFANDVRALEAECKVQVHQGQSVVWITGGSDDAVAEARRTLQEMLQFYLPDACLVLSGLTASAAERLCQDEALGALMARPDCVVSVDEGAECSAWVCGKHLAAVRQRVDALKRQPPTADGAPEAKRRRTSALSVHSQ